MFQSLSKLFILLFRSTSDELKSFGKVRRIIIKKKTVSTPFQRFGKVYSQQYLFNVEINKSFTKNE